MPPFSSLLALSLAALTHGSDVKEAHPTQIAIADTVNAANAGWRAEPRKSLHRPSGWSKSLNGALNVGLTEIPEGVDSEPPSTNHINSIPAAFDSRDQWKNCATIKEVRDQSECGTCWAFATAEMASDRLCIASGQKIQDRISTEDLGFCSLFNGCNGGIPSQAMTWIGQNGVVTGGKNGDASWCSQYSLPACDHHVEGQYVSCDEVEVPRFSPKCPTSCDADSTYGSDFADDKWTFSTGRGTQFSGARNNTQIQAEIVARGPVVAAFTVYADFETYAGGVYKHVTGSAMGGHAVKIIGWGTDKDAGDYWLVANSWNTDWGEEGFFRIARGNNECGIEGQIAVPAGDPTWSHGKMGAGYLRGT